MLLLFNEWIPIYLVQRQLHPYNLPDSYHTSSPGSQGGAPSWVSMEAITGKCDRQLPCTASLYYMLSHETVGQRSQCSICFLCLVLTQYLTHRPSTKYSLRMTQVGHLFGCFVACLTHMPLYSVDDIEVCSDNMHQKPVCSKGIKCTKRWL